MKHYRLAAVLGLSLLLMLLLGACGKERIVYVPVTVTPGGSAETGSATEPEAPTTGESETPAETLTQPELPSLGTGVAVPNSDLALPSGEKGRIAFMGPYGQSNAMHAFVVNSDGTGLKSVSEELGEGYFPSLSPDGSHVIFVSNTTVDPDIFSVEVATNKSVNLTGKPGFDNQPVWSPDGKQIAFVTDREGGDVDPWVMNADGSEARRLARTPGEDKMGSWSPDGTQLVFSNQDELGESLWLIDVASGETSRLTEQQGGNDTAPAWSPNGELIAFYSVSNGGTPVIFTISPDGNDRKQLTDSAVASLFPVWSPDGEWLIYTTISGDRRDVTAMNLASNETRTLPDIQGFATSWAEADQPLADTGFTQGPKQTGVEVDPAVLADAYRIGDDNAPIKIVEFSDYQCPFCQRWVNDVYPQLKAHIEDGTVQLIYVDFPLNIHPQAPAAAQAARCAGELAGADGYWTMHDALFASLAQWNGQATPAPIFSQVASGAGLDGRAIQSCVESGKFASQVDAGLREGTRLGITGTPTFFINGDRLVGAHPWETFQTYINEAGQ